MKHALIIADIEGIVGVDHTNMMNLEESSNLYTQEIQIYIETLLECGIERITVCDSHNEGNMIHPRITKINDGGKCQIRLVSRVDGIPFEDKYDFAILAGLHGMEGSPGVLPHTLRFDFREISVKDMTRNKCIPIGEVEMDSRWLGSKGIPVILVVGDREATYEANSFNPYRMTCCVKSLYQTKCVDKAVVYEKISHSIRVALGLEWELCLSRDDDEIAVKFYNCDTIDFLSSLGYKRIGATIRFNNCSDFLDKLYVLVEQLRQTNKETLKSNVVFLKEVRELAKTLKKEDVSSSDIGYLLNNNLMLLDGKSREKILHRLKTW